jgi:hypothetical protein
MTLTRILATCAASVCALASHAASRAPTDPLTFPQTRGATYAEIQQHQGLGRFVTSHDSSFFLYEFARPFTWPPGNAGLAPAAAARKQHLIYKVTTVGDWLFGNPKSELLFYPAAGATYYLGDLSPDSSRVSMYEIDRDDNRIRAAAVKTNDGISPQTIWFDLVPDSARLDELPMWTSNEEFVYPIASGPTKLARASVATREAKPCADCDPAMLKRAAAALRAEAAALRKTSPKPLTRPGTQFKLPEGARVFARSKAGDLEVYAVDTADLLRLMFRKDEEVFGLFENDRKQFLKNPNRDPNM